MNPSQNSNDNSKDSPCFWPSNLQEYYQPSIQKEYFLLGWNIECEQTSDSNRAVIVAGLINHNSYSFEEVQNAISVWRRQYQNIDLVHDFQIIQCSTLSNTSLILYEPCIGLQYYRHVPCSIHEFYDKCDSYKSSSYDSLLIKITEANRILQDILCLLKNKRFEMNMHVEMQSKDENLKSLPHQCLSYFQMTNSHIPLCSLVRLLLVPSPKTKFETNSTCQTYISIESLAKAQLSRYQCICTNSIDWILGFLCGIMLIHFHQDLVLWLSNLLIWFNDKVLRDYIGWLEQFPVGFKLNVPLTHVFGKYIMIFTSMYDHFLSSLWMYSNTISVGIGCTSIIFGFRSFLALSHDFVRLSTIHISILAYVFHTMLWFQFSLFNSLWHLFRGKKINVLRQRSDTLEYDFMQLFLGTILFVTCLFLFTTMLVYYTFFFILDSLIRCIILLPRACYIFISVFPFAEVLVSLTQPRMLTAQSIVEVHEQMKNAGDKGGTTGHTRYSIRCKTLGTRQIVLHGCTDVLKRI